MQAIHKDSKLPAVLSATGRHGVYDIDHSRKTLQLCEARQLFCVEAVRFQCLLYRFTFVQLYGKAIEEVSN
jgi:hypothetical protein